MAATQTNDVFANIERFFNTMDRKIEAPVRMHLKNVYSSLALGLLAAAAGAYVHVFTDMLKGSFLTGIGSIVLLLVLMATPSNGKNEKLRLGYFLGFGALTGLGMGPLLDVVISINPGIIVTAFMGTCLIFGCFTLAALFAPDRKFLYLGGVLLSALSMMFWMTLINLFVGSQFMWQLNLYGGLMVMCGFVLYDTQIIMEKCRLGDKDYIRHSIDLFIDLWTFSVEC